MEQLQQTPSQTIGPFFAYSLTAVQYGYRYNSIVDSVLFSSETPGQRITITGTIFDGNNNPVPDAIIELYQPDSEGKYQHIPIVQLPNLSISQSPNIPISPTGFGRAGTGTDSEHRFTFTTIKPGSTNGQAPHISIILFMRGSLHALHTRLYFSDEVNDTDELFNSIHPSRRNTLIAQKLEPITGSTYQFNIHLQGENETVFFEV